MAMKSKHQRLILVSAALVALVGAGLLAAAALKDEAAYFYTPAEARAQHVHELRIARARLPRHHGGRIARRKADQQEVQRRDRKDHQQRLEDAPRKERHECQEPLPGCGMKGKRARPA